MKILQARSSAINSLNYALYQMAQAGTLQAIRYEDLNQFTIKSEVQVLNGYELSLEHDGQTISVFIRNLADPNGVAVVNITGQHR